MGLLEVQLARRLLCAAEALAVEQLEAAVPGAAPGESKVLLREQPKPESKESRELPTCKAVAVFGPKRVARWWWWCSETPRPAAEFCDSWRGISGRRRRLLLLLLLPPPLRLVGGENDAADVGSRYCCCCFC